MAFFLAGLIDWMFLLEAKTFIGVAVMLSLWDFVWERLLVRIHWRVRNRLFPTLNEKAEAVTVSPDFRS
jgi:hypothetical protein